MIKIKSKQREASDLGIPYSAYKIAYYRGYGDCEEWHKYCGENNAHIDKIEPITEDVLNDMNERYEKVKRGDGSEV